MKHHFLITSLLFVSLGFLSQCDSGTKAKAQRVTDKFGEVTLVDYQVQFGNSEDELIEKGLTKVLFSLKSTATTIKDVKGTVDMTLRCDADGTIRWAAAGKANLNVENQNEVKNKMTEDLLTTAVKFPELGEVTMIAATFEFK